MNTPSLFQSRSRRPTGLPSARRSPGQTDTSPAKHVILVVEDIEDMRDLYEAALTDAGYEVVTASNGVEAVEAAQRVQPRLIVMDLSMPEMDGWEATRRIRQAALADVPLTILAVSAFTGHSARDEAYTAGADGFVEKPCSPDILLSVIKVFLQAATPPKA